MHVPISRLQFGPEEHAALSAVLSSEQLAKGPRVEELETRFAAYHGARHGVAVGSGTAALTLALIAHGIGAGDEVIIPSFSFFATASAVLGAGAVPVFADIEADSYCLSPDAARAAISPRTRAIMPVHLFGLPADLPRLSALCREHGLLLLEDAAQAHGAAIGDARVGSTGTAAFSFFSSKNMTTGEGGMVLTDDAAVAHRLRMLRNHGRSAEAHELIGSNQRMNELAAALGCVQLTRLPGFNAARRDNAHHFDRYLRGVTTPVASAGTTHVYHQYTVRVPAGDRDRLVTRLNERGVGARVYYKQPIHAQPAILARPGARSLDLPETERASREVLSLPVHPGLTEAERAYVVESVNASV